MAATEFIAGHGSPQSSRIGAEAYRRRLLENAMTVLDEYEDEGENHYDDAIKNA